MVGSDTKALRLFSGNWIFYAGLTGLVLAALILAFSKDVSAQAQLSGCTGDITGVTTLGNTNAGRTSFDAHRNANGGNEGVVDVSIAQGAVSGNISSGLAPANFDHAACSEEQSGTFEGRAYDYALKGWSWNTNLGFLSLNCQGGRNDAGAGIGVACGGVNYGVYLSEPDGGGNRDLIGYAWSPSFGWIQFNGTGGGGVSSSGPVTMDWGDTVTVELGGTSYSVYLDYNLPTGVSYIAVNGVGPVEIMEGETANFGEVNLIVLDFGYMEGPSPHLTFELERVIRSGSRAIDAGETMVVAFDGSSYEVSLDTNTPPGASYVGIDGVYQWVNEGVVATFGDVYLFAKDSIYMEGPSPHLSFELQKPEAGGSDFDYGVTRAADGTLSGYAWTSAGVWTSFSGARIYLPGEEVTEDGDSCVGRPWVCVSIEIDAAGTKIADGTDGYYVDLYLRDSDGASALSEASFSNLDEFLDSLNFVWEDTVKRNQLPAESGAIINAVGDELNDLARPWEQSQEGAVTFKPMNFADFEAVAADPGHYRSIEKVASYAPTAGGNLSYTTGTDPVYSVSNERPVYEDLTTRLEPDRLVLSRVEFDSLLDFSGTPIFTPVPVYPNGQVDLPLEFRPAIFVDDLYVADFQDQIVGYRGVIENISVSTEVIGSLPAVIRDSAEVKFELSYSDEETRASGGGCNAEGGETVFDYNFVTDTGSYTSLERPVSELVSATDFQILASLPTVSADGEEVTLPCAIAASPSLRTIVSYGADTVSYLSNHLPRIAQEGIYNPAVVIHGTVLSQLVGDVQAGKSIDTSGYVNVNKVRDTVNENLEKYLVSVNSRTGANCVVTKLKQTAGNPVVDRANFSVCKPQNYKTFKVGTENVLYTKGNDITLKLTSITSGSSWVVISDGGNIFIDGDLYGLGSNSLALVTFRDEDNYLATGNVYIHPDVLNIQATIVADGTVFSYNGDHAAINTDGEPIWPSHADMMDINSNQLKWDGAGFSRNTIGGADIDQGSNPKNYLLIGGGEIINLSDANLEARMRAQQYDLNYLRTFRTVLERNESGLPIDQKCYRPLTTENVVAISNGETLCGDIGDCDPDGSPDQLYACDGINPLRRYNLTNISGVAAGPDGDLVAPTDIEGLAQGLNNTGEGATDFDPVYIFYAAPSKDSFLFSKAGALSIN